jgi:hypothetical protein
MTADMALTLSGLLLELILTVLLFVRRVHRTLSTFVGFVAVALCTDAFASLVPGIISRGLYLYLWIASLFLEFFCFLGLTVELGRNLLRHNRATSPNWFLAFVLFIPVLWVLTLLSHWTIPNHLPLVWQIELRTSQGTAVLCLAAYLALVWWGKLRHLHWPHREFRVAVGIGLEALVGLAAVIIHSHQPVGPSYHWVDVSASVVYVGVLVYWVQYFVFEDQPADSSSRAGELAGASRSGSESRREMFVGRGFLRSHGLLRATRRESET